MHCHSRQGRALSKMGALHALVANHLLCESLTIFCNMLFASWTLALEITCELDIQLMSNHDSTFCQKAFRHCFLKSTVCIM